MAEATGKTPTAIIQNGELTPEIIAETPDFRTILRSEPYKSILESAGYRLGERDSGDREGARDVAGTVGETAASAGYIGEAASRVENLLAFRKQRAGIERELAGAMDEAESYGGKLVPERVASRIRGMESRLSRLDASLAGVKSPDYRSERFSLSEGEVNEEARQLELSLSQNPYAVQGRVGTERDGNSGESGEVQRTPVSIIASQVVEGLICGPVNS